MLGQLSLMISLIRPLFDLEYGLDGVFDQSPEYVDESASSVLRMRVIPLDWKPLDR